MTRSEGHPLVLVALALSAWVYFPITRTFFFADDFVHLADLHNESTLGFLLKPFAGNAFLVRNLVFLGSYRLFGLDPVAFQWTILLTHLVNVALLFGLLRGTTGSAWLGCLGATLWGTSPLVAETLNWYSAFGHVLVGICLLLVLRDVVRTDDEGGRIPTRATFAWFVLLLVGSTCYGPGIGAALVFPVAVVVLLPAVWRQRGVLLAVLALPVATLALYYGMRRLYTMIGWLSLEELVHQSIAFSGFEMIPLLWVHLLGYSTAGTVLGFWLPKEYPHGAGVGAIAAVGVGLAFLLWRGSARTRRLTLAMLVLWSGIYLMIAVGRAHLYAILRVPTTEAAMVGRYHYAGTIPLVVALCLILRQLGHLPGLRPVPSGLAVAAGLAIMLAGSFHAGFRIDNRRAAHDYFMYTQTDLAAAVAAAPAGEPMRFENGETPLYVLGTMPNRLFPGRAAVFLLSPPPDLDGRDVRFVEHDPQVLFWCDQHPDTPLARLIIPAKEPREAP